MGKKAAQNRELKRSDMSGATPERFGKSYFYAVQSTITKNFFKTKSFEKDFKSEQKDKRYEAMKAEIESSNETETLNLFQKKDKIILLADGCTKSNMTQTEILTNLKLVL